MYSNFYYYFHLVTYGPLTPEEDKLILRYYSEMGTKWAEMGKLLGRPANLIKNRYYSSLCKKYEKSNDSSNDDDNDNDDKVIDFDYKVKIKRIKFDGKER